RADWARHSVYGSEGVAAVQRFRIDHHDRVSCFSERFSWFRRVCSEQGGIALIRTHVAQRTEGQAYPGERAEPRAGRHTGFPATRQGGEGDVRIPDPAGKDGSSRGNCSGRAVSCFRRIELCKWGGFGCRRRLLGHLNSRPIAGGILLPSSVTIPTLLFLEPRVPAQSKGA